jgi:hypothetical protein
MMEAAESLPVEEKRFVGGYVPKQLVGHLALYSAHTNISRASLIESFLIRTLEKAPPPEILCKSLAERAITKWKKDKVSGVSVRWETFLRRTGSSLGRKKIPESYVKYILALIHKMKPGGSI